MTCLAIGLLLTMCLQGQSFLQARVSCSFDNIPCAEALRILEVQSGARFAYSSQLLPEGCRAYFLVENQPLRKVLERLFPEGIRYEEMGGQIVLFPGAAAPPVRNHRLSGFVRDAETGELLLGASIQSSQGGVTQTNEHGFFSLSVPERPDSFSLLVQYVGFDNLKLLCPPLLEDSMVVVRLNPFSDSLHTLTVTATRLRGFLTQTQLGLVEVNGQLLQNGISVLGQSDVFQQLQQLPGVQGGLEGATGFFVRGGNADQNLVLLDGVPLYNPFHVFGLISVLPSSSINKISLYKGVLPARFDGRLSSVLDVRLREGNAREWRGEINGGMLFASAMLEGPIIKDRLTVLLAVRRTTIDWLTLLLSSLASTDPLAQTTIRYHVFDFNGKLSFRLSEKDQLAISCYAGSERFVLRNYTLFAGQDNAVDSTDNNNQVDWSNVTTAFFWRRTYGPKWFGNTTLTFTRYRFRSASLDARFDENAYKLYRNAIRTRIQDYGFLSDWNYRPTNDRTWRFGTQWTVHQFNVYQTDIYENVGLEGYPAFRDSLERFDQFRKVPSVWSVEAQGFVEFEWRMPRGWTVQMGLTGSLFRSDAPNIFAGLMPRFLFSKTWYNGIRVEAAFGGANQYLHQPVGTALTLPSDMWVYSTSGVQPQRSLQWSGGIFYTLKNEITFSLEAYHKYLWHVSALKPGTGLSGEPELNWRSNIIQGKGWGDGLEFMAQRPFGKLTGWVGYTLSWAYRQYKELNGGERFPFRFDRRHTLSISLNWQITKKVAFSATWRFNTGSPTGGTVAFAPGTSTEQELLYLQSIAAFRLPPVHRLDAAFSFKKEKKHLEWVLQLGVFNAYNRINPAYVRLTRNELGAYQYSYVGFLPLVPVLQWTFRFK